MTNGYGIDPPTDPDREADLDDTINTMKKADTELGVASEKIDEARKSLQASIKRYEERRNVPTD